MIEPVKHSSKNITVKHDKPIYKRWVVLDVDVEAVDALRTYTERTGLKMGPGLSKIIRAGVKLKKVHK